MQKYTHNFLKKILSGYLFLGLIPFILLVVIIVEVASSYLRDSLVNSVTQSSLYMSYNLTNLFTEYDDLSRYIYEYRSADGLYLHTLLSGEKVRPAELREGVNSMLLQILYRNDDVAGVSFLCADGELYQVSRSEKGIFGKELPEFLDREEIRSDPAHAHILLGTLEGEQHLFLVRAYMNTESILTTGDCLGTLIMEIAFDRIETVLKPFTETGLQNYALADQEASILLYPDRNTEDERLQVIRSRISEEDLFTFRYGQQYMICRRIPIADWILFTDIPVFTVDPKSFLTNSGLFLVILITVVGTFSLYTRYTQRITVPVKRITSAMQEIEKGNLDIHLPSSSNDEFALISHTLNTMTQNLRSYIEKEYISEIQQRNAELDTLKMQIRPHYLYNSLEIIHMSAIEKDDQVTAEMISHLSRQLQYLTEGGRSIVPLRREIENAWEYFSFVQMRYNNRFTFDIQVPEELGSVQVPKLILQPLVENCIKHAFADTESGVISLTVKNLEEKIVLEIIDNGCGIDSEKCAQLNDGIEHLDYRSISKSSHIGVLNAASRIRFYSRESASMKITSIPDIGTIVSVYFPKGCFEQACESEEREVLDS